MAVTTTTKVPFGVDVEVESVNVAVQVGTQPDGANVALAPDGSPDAPNVTPAAVPETRVAVTEAVAASPAVTVPVAGLTERLKSKDGGGDWTVKEYVVVRVSPPPTAFTVIEYVPAGVEVVVEIVIVLVQVGTHWDGAKEAVAPAGRPVPLKVTAVDVPETRVAVTEAVAEPPAVTLPEVGLTERLKSKDGGGDSIVKE